jgi:integrating conjugative element protein (TIGR03757 family)
MLKLKRKSLVIFVGTVLLNQVLYASPLPAIDVFLLPGQNAENMENLNVNACNVVDLRGAQQAMQNQVQQKYLTKDSLMSQIKSSSQAISQQVQCVSYAHALGVKRFPGIVFDEQYVVYGMTDVQAALELYQEKVENKTEESQQ